MTTRPENEANKNEPIEMSSLSP